MKTEELLKKLVDASAVSGSEDSMRELMKKELKPFADDISVDKIGNLIARKGSGSPKIMISAHMDRLGMMVKYIDEKGFIRFERVGGWDTRILPSQKIVIHGSKDPVIGVIGSKSVHLMDEEEKKKPVNIKKMFIDMGAKERKGVEKAGVSVGDIITIHSEYSRMAGTRVTGCGFDDRIGCLELIEVVKRVGKFKGTLYAVGTVQEETNLVGVRGSMFGIDPDAMIALDVTLVGDMPEMKPGEVSTELGSGPVFTLKDNISFIHPQVRKWAEETAKKARIPFQRLVTSAGADDSSVAAIIRKGIPSGAISTPCRYLHTPIEVADMNDIENVIKLVAEMVRTASKYF